MKKISTIKLLGVLVVLLLIYGATEIFSTTGRSKSFKEELITIDSEAVTQIGVTKDSKQTKIFQSEGKWQVSTEGGTVYNAVEDKVDGMLSTLQTIKPSRIASKNPEKWQEFQVDSSGTRVEVFEGNKKSLDIIIGRFGMKGQQQFYTFVRLSDDDNVYVADNFMGFSISPGEENYRNQTITSFDQDSITVVRFSYPADSSFSIMKSLNGNWTSERFTPDSTKTVQFLNGLSRLTSAKFENAVNTGGLEPLFKTTIETPGQDPIELNAFAKNDSVYIITSTHNPEGKFEDQNLFDKIFVSESSLYPEAPGPGTE